MSDSDQDKAEKPVKLVHYTTAELLTVFSLRESFG